MIPVMAELNKIEVLHGINNYTMISILSTTGKYILQPSLIEMHRKSLDLMSQSILWKKELNFFQTLLDKFGTSFKTLEQKKRVDHFQHIITYYNGEVVDVLRKKLRVHEEHLATMLQSLNEADTEYYKEHNGILEELIAFQLTFNDLKHEFFAFIEQGMTH